MVDGSKSWCLWGEGPWAACRSVRCGAARDEEGLANLLAFRVQARQPARATRRRTYVPMYPCTIFRTSSLSIQFVVRGGLCMRKSHSLFFSFRFGACVFKFQVLSLFCDGHKESVGSLVGCRDLLPSVVRAMTALQVFFLLSFLSSIAQRTIQIQPPCRPDAEQISSPQVASLSRGPLYPAPTCTKRLLVRDKHKTPSPLLLSPRSPGPRDLMAGKVSVPNSQDQSPDTRPSRRIQSNRIVESE